MLLMPHSFKMDIKCLLLLLREPIPSSPITTEGKEEIEIDVISDESTNSRHNSTPTHTSLQVPTEQPNIIHQDMIETNRKNKGRKC